MIPTANLLIIPEIVFCLVLSLPNDGMNYFLMELKIPIFCSIIFKCVISYSDVTMTPGCHQKVQKIFAVYLNPHLTVKLPGEVMGQNFRDHLNLLHAQEVNVEDAGKSGPVQNEHNLEWSLQLEG